MTKKRRAPRRGSYIYDKLPKSVKNPYAPGSKKAEAFELFRAGGERAALYAKLRQLGVAHHTALNWITLFLRVGAAHDRAAE